MTKTKTPIRVASDTRPDTSYNASHAGIMEAVEDGYALRLTEVQGVSTTHSIYVYYQTGLLVYVYAPQSGSMESMWQWNTKVRDFPAWKPPADGRVSEQAQYGAMLYALNEATREIAAELDTEVVTA